ncbi:MAG: hypothetical protein U5K69_08655 [Balneolaceae bacterium]|nr:hypothetical protein [Balneolaceae bacterium]
MLKKLCFFLLFPVIGYSQSLDVSVEQWTAGNQYTTFGLAQHNVSFSNNSITFTTPGVQFGDYLSYGVAPDYSLIGILKNTMQGEQAFVMNPAADTLSNFETISVSYDDPSLRLKTFNSGAVLLRNNIANFTLYSPLGSIKTSGSSSSQSEQGESISEMATDAHGKTVLIYTPKINQGEGIGSQAQILKGDNSTENIFYSSSRSISYGDVSDDGQFILLITASEGSNDEVIILDRFGNELGSIESEEDLIGAHLTGNGEQFIIYSSRRALVYSSLNGERIGSTSFRSPLILAQYVAEDQTIIGLTGSKVESTEIYKDLEFHAINLEQREIAGKNSVELWVAVPILTSHFLGREQGTINCRERTKS